MCSFYLNSFYLNSSFLFFLSFFTFSHRQKLPDIKPIAVPRPRRRPSFYMNDEDGLYSINLYLHFFAFNAFHTPSNRDQIEHVGKFDHLLKVKKRLLPCLKLVI